jgi:hypothetical protein
MLEMEMAKKDPQAVQKLKAVADKLKARQAASLATRKQRETQLASNVRDKLLRRKSLFKKQIEEGDEEEETNVAPLKVQRSFTNRSASEFDSDGDDSGIDSDDDDGEFDPRCDEAYRADADELAFVLARRPTETELIQRLLKKLKDKEDAIAKRSSADRAQLSKAFRSRQRTTNLAAHPSSDDSDVEVAPGQKVPGLKVAKRAARDPSIRLLAAERERLVKEHGAGHERVKHAEKLIFERAHELRRIRYGARTGGRPKHGDRAYDANDDARLRRKDSTGRMRFEAERPNDPYDLSRGQLGKDKGGPRWGFGKMADEAFKYISDLYETEKKKGGSGPAHQQRLQQLEQWLATREEELAKMRSARGPFRSTDDPAYRKLFDEFHRLMREPAKNAARLAELQRLMVERHAVLAKFSAEEQEKLVAAAMAADAASDNRRANKVAGHRRRRESGEAGALETQESVVGMKGGPIKSMLRGRVRRAVGALGGDDQYQAWFEEAERLRRDPIANADRLAWLEAQMKKRAEDLERQKEEDSERAKLLMANKEDDAAKKRAAVDLMRKETQAKKDKLEAEKAQKAAQLAKEKEEEQKRNEAKKQREEAEMLKRKALVRAKRGGGGDENGGLTEEELTMLRGHYDKVDLDGSGEIDKDEFCTFYNNVFGGGMNKKELYELFDKLDVDGGGSLSFDEFVKVYKIMLEMEMAKKDPTGAQKLKDLEGQLTKKKTGVASALAARKGLAALKSMRKPVAPQPAAPAGEPTAEQQRLQSFRHQPSMRRRTVVAMVGEDDEEDAQLPTHTPARARRRSSVASVDSVEENTESGTISRRTSRRGSGAMQHAEGDDDSSLSGTHSRSQSFRHSNDGSESEADSADEEADRLADELAELDAEHDNSEVAAARRADIEARIAANQAVRAQRRDDAKRSKIARKASKRFGQAKSEHKDHLKGVAEKEREEKRRLKEQREAEKAAEMAALRERVRKQNEEKKKPNLRTAAAAAVAQRRGLNFTGDDDMQPSGHQPLARKQSTGSMVKKRSLLRTHSQTGGQTDDDDGDVQSHRSGTSASRTFGHEHNSSGDDASGDDAETLDNDQVDFGSAKRKSAARIARSRGDDKGSDEDSDGPAQEDSLAPIKSFGGVVRRQMARRPANADDEKKAVAAQLREQEKERKRAMEEAKAKEIAERREKLRLEREARMQRKEPLKPAPPKAPGTGRPQPAGQ